MSNIKVSVLVFCYNHGKYLRRCLSSLVNQETNFDYQIIVHDDASTDKSVQIIKQFQQKYPNKIVPIFQKQNQYSKNIIIMKDFLLPKTTGKYCAICQGDDYWIDNCKLQSQYDALENNPSCHFCVHKTIRIDTQSDQGINLYSYQNNADLNSCNIYHSGIYNNKNFIVLFEQFLTSFHVTSWFFITSEFKNYINNLPEFSSLIYNTTRNSDMCDLLYLFSLGDVYFINKYMSVYQCGHDGSWSLKNCDNQSYRMNIIFQMFRQFDKWYKYKYIN